MAILRILRYPDPFLRKPTLPWQVDEDFEMQRPPSVAELSRILDDMEETLKTVDKGAALAANQVGIGRSIFVLNDAAERVETKHGLCFVNPVWAPLDDEMETETEGCLSFPGITLPISRFKRIRVAALDAAEVMFEADYEGFMARVVQHECEHLEGRLFVDHLNAKKKHQVLQQMLKKKRGR